MCDVCGDNRFEIIEAYKRKLIEATNIESSPEEMAVIDNILFRFWQMGWLSAAQPESEERMGKSEQNVLKEDLISRKAAIDAVYGRIRQIGYENNPLVLSIRQAIRDLPTAKPERKKGRWIGGEIGHCSCCGHKGCASDIWNDCNDGKFCPNCGADMRGEQDE